MAYLDVLPLATMKTYLRIDDDQNETDAEITSMIKSALRHIERFTNVIVTLNATKEFSITKGEVRIYDHPINSVVKGIDDDDADVTLTYKTNYYKTKKHFSTNYYSIDIDAITLVLSVGYTDPDDVPSDLIDVAKEMVKIMFYELEDDKSFKEALSPMSKEILNANRRFTI